MTWNWGSERELSWQKSDIESDCGSNLFCRVEPRLRGRWRKPSSLHHCIQKALSSIVFLQVMNNLVSSHWFNPVTVLREGTVGICETEFFGGDALVVLWVLCFSGRETTTSPPDRDHHARVTSLHQTRLSSLASSGEGSKLLPSLGIFKVLWSPVVIPRGRQILMWRMLTNQSPCLLSQNLPSLWLSWQCLLGWKAVCVSWELSCLGWRRAFWAEDRVMLLVQHSVHHCLCYYCFTFVFVRTAYWWLRVKTLSFSALLSSRKRKKAAFLLGKTQNYSGASTSAVFIHDQIQAD